MKKLFFYLFLSIEYRVSKENNFESCQGKKNCIGQFISKLLHDISEITHQFLKNALVVLATE